MKFFLFNIRNIFIFSLFSITFISCYDSKTKSEISHKAKLKDHGFGQKEYGLLKTVYGNLIISFYEEDAPNTINRIKSLIHKGFYDGLIFHKVIPGFVIQTGDPSNSGKKGSGINIQDEISPRKHIKGTLAMAKDPSIPDSADSQFYIALKTLPELDNKYSIFAYVKEGIEILDKIKKGDRILSFSIINRIK